VKKKYSHGARSHGLGGLASERPLLEGCGELDEQLFRCFMVLRMLRKGNGPEQSADIHIVYIHTYTRAHAYTTHTIHVHTYIHAPG
jgi:hypothetical protein